MVFKSVLEASKRTTLALMLGLTLGQLVLLPCPSFAADPTEEDGSPVGGSSTDGPDDFSPEGLIAGMGELPNHPGQALEADQLAERLKAATERTARINGDDAEVRLGDPYSQIGQNLVVIEKDGTQRKAYTDRVNENFPEGPAQYSLPKDVIARYDDATKELILEISSVNGKPLRQGRTFQRRIVRPGVRQILKDPQHIHILLESGDIYTVLLAHAGLFSANARAKGGNFLVAYVGEIDPKLLDAEGRVREGVTLDFYDSRQALARGGDISLVAWDLARYGDLVVKEQPDSKVAVQHLSYASLADAQATHVDFIGRQFRIFSGEEDPLTAGLGLLMGSEHQEQANPVLDRLLAGRSFGEALAETKGLGHFLRVTAGDWGDGPWEDRKLSSTNFNALKGQTAHAMSVASNPYARSTYNTELDLDDPAVFVKTLEQKVRERIELPATDKPSRWQQGMKTARSVGEYAISRAGKLVVVGALAATTLGLVSAGVAGWNGDLASSPEHFIRILQTMGTFAVSLFPEAWALYDPLHRVKLFDLGFVEGPEVYYMAKFAAMSVMFGVLILSAPTLLFARFDKKVLGRELPKDGFWEGVFVGLKVYYTVALRLVSRLLISQRTNVASMFGRSDVLQAVRMGVLPKDYARFGGDGVEGENSSVRLQQKLQQGAVANQFVLVTLLLGGLQASGKVNADTDIQDFKRIRESLSAEEYELLKQKAAYLSTLVWKKLEPTLLASTGNLDKDAAKNLFMESLQDETIQEVVQNLFAPLTAEQKEVLLKAAKEKNALKVLMRWSGQDETYYEFRNGEVPDNVISEALGWNSFVDLVMHVPCAVVIPAFANYADPSMLAATDTGLGGVIAPRLLVELFENATAWIKNTPQEVWTWRVAEATNLSRAYVNPELHQLTSKVRAQLISRRPATLKESGDRYNRGYKGLNLLYGIEKMGHRMSVAEVKGLKLVLLIGTALTFYGYASDFPWKSTFQGSWADTMSNLALCTMALTWDSVAKIVASTGLAYLTYRPLWQWHNLGLREAGTRMDSERERLGAAITRATVAQVELEKWVERRKAGDSSEDMDKLETFHRDHLRQALLDLSSFAAQAGAPLKAGIDKALVESDPALQAVKLREILSQSSMLAPAAEAAPADAKFTMQQFSEDLLNVAPNIVRDIQLDPRGPMVAHNMHKSLMTWGIGITTTVIGLAAFGFAWKYAVGLNPVQVFGIAGGIWGIGRGLKVTMRAARARLGYVKTLRSVRAVLEDPTASDEKVYETILRATRLYDHYETTLAAVNMSSLHPQRKDLREVLKQAYEYMLASPPGVTTKVGTKVMATEAAAQASRPLRCPEALRAAGV